MAREDDPRLRLDILILKEEVLKKYETADSASSRLNDVPPFCNFCGKARNEVEGMVRGYNAYMCNECVAKAHEIFSVSPSIERRD